MHLLSIILCAPFQLRADEFYSNSLVILYVHYIK